MSAAQPATVWPVDRRGALLLGIAAVVVWLLLPTAPNYDTASHLLWGREILAGRPPGIEDAAAPTLHPLWLLVAIPAAATGVGAALLQLVALVSFAVVIACAWRLGARIAGGVAGTLAAIAAGSSFALMLLAFKAYVDLPFLALVLTALVVEWGDSDNPSDASAAEAGHERESSADARATPVAGGVSPLIVPALLFVAGLLRPEAWAFGLLFVGLRAFRGAALRAQVLPALVVLAAPVIWLITDLLLTGDPLHSLTGTQELAEELGRPTGLASAPKELAVLLGDLARPPVAAAGLLGIGFAVWLRGWRQLLLPLAVLAAAGAGFLLVGALGLPLLQRYLLVPAVLVCVLAGVAGAVLLAWARGRREPGGEVAPPARASLRGLATAALAVGALGVAGYLVTKADSFRIVAQGVLREARWQREAAELLDDPAVVRAAQCGPITLPTYRFIPELTLRADRPADAIVSRATALGGAGTQSAGVAIVIEGTRAAKVRLGWAAGVPRETNDVPAGFTEVARRGPFVATARCG